MKNTNYLSSWIKRFLLEYLINIRNLSKNTQQSYRDTFKLLLPFIANKVKKSIDQLLVDDMSSDTIRAGLLHLENNRHCSLSTCNQRLAAIHDFAKFVGFNSPEHVEWCRQIQIIPFKKAEHSLITYLNKSEMDALLNAPNKYTDQGKRDYALLLFLYNTGVRADEATQLTIADLNMAHAKKRDLSTVVIRGKGNKLRRCPLWQQTTNELCVLILNREQNEHVFLNRCKQPLTRFGLHTMVKRYVKKISKQLPSLERKRVSPHTIRHTTATHLLHAGVDINTIRAWLGHVSINTTNIYAEVDLEMKARALACCEIIEDKQPTHWRNNKNLMSFLNAI
ncbi:MULTISPECIES: tyrosine-type recombinase/integrase [unclassified Candidatus Tisiphia]|uniref:tyrosine-type recombinase/integrase n=1 Tax=unclassified Candidatus Tisiphia TaxID=2996318 RepID=UPI00312CA27E